VLVCFGDREMEIARIFGGKNYTHERCINDIREQWHIEPTERRGR